MVIIQVDMGDEETVMNFIPRYLSDQLHNWFYRSCMFLLKTTVIF